jgi:hypothetical protein
MVSRRKKGFITFTPEALSIKLFTAIINFEVTYLRTDIRLGCKLHTEQGDQKIREKICPNFGKSSQNSRQTKKGAKA